MVALAFTSSVLQWFLLPSPPSPSSSPSPSSPPSPSPLLLQSSPFLLQRSCAACALLCPCRALRMQVVILLLHTFVLLRFARGEFLFFQHEVFLLRLLQPLRRFHL